MTITSPAAPGDAIFELASGLWVSRALWLAARFRIADAVDQQPKPLACIAEETATDTDTLGRLLRALASVGVFRAEGDGFVHSPLSEVLRSDSATSQRALIESLFGHEHYAAWGSIADSLRSGETAFDRHFGKRQFDWLAENPVPAKLFGEAMTGATLWMEEAVVAAHDFGAFELGVDVGGSHGSFIRRLLARTPQGRGILYDLPATVKEGERTWRDAPETSRLSAVGGDFFVSVPDGGDLYLLKFILHDWDDEHALLILNNIRASMRQDAAIAIVEMMLPDETTVPHVGWFLDLNMLALTGGRERSRAQYAALLERAGLRLESTTPTASPVTVLVARKV